MSTGSTTAANTPFKAPPPFFHARCVGCWIVLGIVKVMTGWALIQGRSWARVVGIIFVFLNAVSAMAGLGQQPFLSLLLIALDVTILYALTVRWEAAKVGMGD